MRCISPSVFTLVAEFFDPFLLLSTYSKTTSPQILSRTVFVINVGPGIPLPPNHIISRVESRSYYILKDKSSSYLSHALVRRKAHISNTRYLCLLFSVGIITMRTVIHASTLISMAANVCNYSYFNNIVLVCCDQTRLCQPLLSECIPKRPDNEWGEN